MVGEREDRRKDVEIVSIESLVPEEHLLRKIDAVLEDEYLYELLRPLYSSDRGRKSIDPVVLIKMVLLQHLYGIRSMRQTAQEAEVNIAYRWFLGMDFHAKIPHFSTISYAFRKRFTSEIFEEIFTWILEKAMSLGYVEPETVYIDSTHIKACANNYKKRKKTAAKAARVYEQQLREEIGAERKERGKKPFDDDDDEPPEEQEITESTSDPESGVFRKGEHKTVFAYSAQTACDKHNFVVGVEVNAGNVHDSVGFDKIYEEVTERIPEIKKVVMDSGYKTPWICKKVQEDGREAIMPYMRPKGRKSGYRPKEYVYDEQRDCVICPQGEELRYRTTNRKGYREYKSDPKVCCQCGARERCTQSKNCQKVVIRHIWADHVDRAEAVRLTEEGREIYKERSRTIERVFADAKEKHGMRYTNLRGLTRVGDWIKLKFACMNLKKMAVWTW